MSEQPKYCVTCKHAYRPEGNAKYLRCRKSPADEHDDSSLAGEMRKGTCADGALWEALNGDA